MSGQCACTSAAGRLPEPKARVAKLLAPGWADSESLDRRRGARPPRNDALRCGWLVRESISICRCRLRFGALRGLGCWWRLRRRRLRRRLTPTPPPRVAAKVTPRRHVAGIPRRWVAFLLTRSLITCSCDYERRIFAYSLQQFDVCHCCRNYAVSHFI